MKSLCVKLATVFGLIISTVSVQAETLQMSIDVRDGFSAYEKTTANKTDVVYELVENRATTYMNVGGRSTVETINQVPGRKDPGFARLTVRKLSNASVILSFNQLSYGVVNGRQYQIPLNIDVQASIVGATWADYLANRNVQFAISGAEKQRYLGALREVFRTTLEKQLNLELAQHGRRASVRVTRFDFDESPITGTLNRLASETSGLIEMSARF